MHINLIFKLLGWLLAGLLLFTSSANAGGLPLSPMTTVSPPYWGQGFALELFKTLCRIQPGVNTLASPLSVYSALTMVASGAHGATLEAMATTLHEDPAKWDQVEKRMAAYLSYVENNERKVAFRLANALWTARDTVLENAYVDRMKTQYRARVSPLPEDDAAGAVNAWVSRQTNGKIAQIVDQIDPELALLLVNAAYFKGAWKTPFPMDNTAAGDFHADDGEPVAVQYMSRHGQFGYIQKKGMQAVRIAYRDPGFCMLVILPPSDVTLDAFVDTLTPSSIDALRNGMTHTRGHVMLPKFQLQSGLNLREPLTQMGMGIAFNGEKADFSKIASSPPLAISDVRHRCYLKVDEKGSEAAAATSVTMIGTSLPLGAPFEFIADRPFLCLIEDMAAGRILFMGAVHRPE